MLLVFRLIQVSFSNHSILYQLDHNQVMYEDVNMTMKYVRHKGINLAQLLYGHLGVNSLQKLAQETLSAVSIFM